MESCCSLAVFLIISVPIVANSIWREYREERLFDYMVNSSWVGQPEIAIVALFLGRNLCDLIVGLESFVLVVHHLLGMYSMIMVSTMNPYKNRYLGNHCTYLVFMEAASIWFNIYVLWPKELNRNIYFGLMSTSNVFGFFWHWVAGSLGDHRALHDPFVFVTVTLGSVINFFRQKEVFAVCGCPCWLGGNGLLSPASVITALSTEDATTRLNEQMKSNAKHSVSSVGGVILDDKNK